MDNMAPMPDFDYELNTDNEDVNDGSRRIEIAEERAQFYMNLFHHKFEEDQQVEPDNKESCFGVLVHFKNGKPMAMDPDTTIQNDGRFELLCKIIDNTNEPIYILHLKGAKQISPEELKSKYFDLFIRPLVASAETPNAAAAANTDSPAATAAANAESPAGAELNP
jgi:hypothetical protein